MNKFLLLAIGCVFFTTKLAAQAASDIVVPITVTTTSSPPSITLNFPATANSVNTIVGRKLINQTAWSFVALQPNSTTFTDSGVLPGIGFEYIVIKQTSVAPTTRVGLVYAGIEVPATAYRGKMILVVDDQLAAPLSMELERFEQDLRGDGYQVLRQDIDVASSTVSSVKALLSGLYDQDPGNTVTALLFGDIPVPYSGNINPDAQPDHLGAWPTDYYYGDMDEQAWTDSIVNNTVATRPANHNVPGDGKFDQSQTPTLAEMVVSRVDFSNLSGWDVSQTELYRRYLDKNHNFRTGAYKPDNQTLIDDNFGFSGGGAFSQNGWRNGYALTGPGSMVQGNFFAESADQSFLIGYGCGGGNYTSANGVGSSANFQTDSVNIVFSMLFGNYFGDWDFETNPFMPSALASKGGILSCSWAGSPNWHLHHMGLGQPVFISTFWVWLNSFLTNPVYPPNFGDDLIHVGLLGDPTLRAHNVRPPEDAQAAASCDEVTLGWKASPDADLGYLIYRASSLDSVFELIVNSPILATTFVDTMPLPGMNYYQIKSFRLEMVPTGSYYNQSVGTPAAVNFNTDPLTPTPSATPISCNGASDGIINLDVTGGAPGYNFTWSNGTNAQNLTNLPPGTYTVTVTDQQGCTATATAVVQSPPAISLILDGNNVLCFGQSNGSINADASGGTPGFTYEWSTGETTQNISDLPAGTYTVTVTDTNGCTETSAETITQPAILMVALIPQNVSCNGLSDGNINLDVIGGTPGYNYAWSNGSTAQNLNDVPAGTYTVTATDANGCSETGSETISEPTAISTNTDVTNAGCAGATNGAIDLTVGGGSPGYTFAWSNGETTEDLTDIAAGTYTVTVTDSGGCTQTTTATVGQVTTLEAQTTQTDASCFGSADGSAEAMASGGDPGYSYEWSTGNTNSQIDNLPAGTYTVTVTDMAGCTQTATATVAQPPVIDALAGAWEALPCEQNVGSVLLDISGGTPGYTFLWSTGATTQNLENVAPGTYTVTITDANGCTAVDENDAIVQPPPPLQAETAFQQTSCTGMTPVLGSVSSDVSGGVGPYTYLWSNGATTAELTDVPVGAYTVTVTDANGCTTEHTNMMNITYLPWTINATFQEISCYGGADGTIDLTVSGGNGPNYTYLWSTGETTPDIMDLTAGDYTVTITDESGCTVSSSIFLMEPGEMVLESLTTSATCTAGGAINVNVLFGGTPGFSFNWTGPDGFASTDEDLTDLQTGAYQLTVTDANGCTNFFEYQILFVDEPPVVFLAGVDTVCVDVPGNFLLAPDVGTSYQWDPGANGTVVSGQGTAMASIQWSSTGNQNVILVYGYGTGCLDSISRPVFVDICVGTNEPQLAGVHIQPNPFGDWLTVQFDRPVEPGSRLRLMDMQGRLIFAQNNLTETTRLETAHLPAGSYLIQLIENGRAGIWKVVRY